MSYEFITTEKRGKVLVLTMNRPELYNAVHAPMHDEMHAAWNAFAADPDLWVAVLTGAGEKAFSAGNDLKYTANGGKGASQPTGFGGIVARFDLDKPVIAAVNGFAVGGGFEMALSCDIILAADNATFALPEVKVGFFPAASGIQRLIRETSRKKALELILTGRRVGAVEGAAMGFVNEVVPQAELMARAMRMADELAAVSPSALRATKRVLNYMDAIARLEESLLFNREVLAELRRTEDFAEGVKAFVEKRKPVWNNR
ncbi:enoyl-CoA hydratase [Martelella lutilitoris]|uniref:Enoyl-CoA hydratase n=1 Tax=Martelella lutilitoris TaxID=2583532 RepID=A0A5C4JRC3_9HYPH|nr:enoyl-CoA hydratase-related protein [Martelella lutilitoris]TNB47772.1 enoyl-CoA hydratase [Martelella lutilitoris]